MPLFEPPNSSRRRTSLTHDRHLLSKKSWNVYNPAAIARVRADEAAAAAREEAEEQRQDAYEAECRNARLRGLPPPEPTHRSPSPPVKRSQNDREKSDKSRQRNDDPRKRRRLHGEDDTDRDLRYARQDQERREDRRTAFQSDKRKEDMPLTDHAGHIQLFAAPSVKEIRANKDVEVDFKKKQQEAFEDGAMRFSDAAGFKKDAKGRPWYAEPRGYSGTEELDSRFTHGDDVGAGKDAFGNPDPGRAKRDGARMAASDPLAVMAQAQKRLKEVQNERKEWRSNREKELREIEALQAETDRKAKRRSDEELKGLEDPDDFRLDGGQLSRDERHRTHHKRHHHSSHRNLDGEDVKSSRRVDAGSSRHRDRNRSRSRSPMQHDRGGNNRDREYRNERKRRHHGRG